MSKSKFITVITEVYIYDEYAEGPSFVAFKFDKEEVMKIGEYRHGIEDMNAKGLNPYKVSTFNTPAMFLDPIDADPLNEEEANTLRFFSDSDKDEWESRFVTPMDGEDDDETSTLLDLDGEHCVDIEMLNITESAISATASLKHIGVRIESSVLRDVEFNQINKWLEELDA
jgi:hypothetical protein